MVLVPALLAATVAGLLVASFGIVVTADNFLILSLVGGGFAGTAVLIRSPGMLFRNLVPGLSPWALMLLCLTFFILANLRYPQLLSVPEEIVAIDQLNRRITVTGTIVDIRQLSDGRSRFDILTEQIADNDPRTAPTRPFRLQLTIEEGTEVLLPGDRIRFNARLRQPRLFGTPGEFHWPRYLAARQTFMTAWLPNLDRIEIVAHERRFPARQIVDLRRTVAGTISAALPTERATLVRALVLGEGHQLPDQLRRLLAGAGVSHLFAISGLHLGLLGVFGYNLLLVLYRRSIRLLTWQPPQRVLPLLLLPLLLFYLLFTGDAVATRRAFALACVGAVLLLWRYSINPLHLLCGAALISLLVNPLLLWQAGWQLSFSGAAGILLWRPLWQHPKVAGIRPLPLRYQVQVLLVTVAATLATLPWVLLNFHLLAPAGLLTNPVLVPVVTLVALPLGFIGLIIFPVSPQIAVLLFQGCGWCLDLLVRFSVWIVNLPGLGSLDLYPSRASHLAVVLMIVPLLAFPYLYRRLLVGYLVAAVVVIPILWNLPPISRQRLSLTMFSVGQGESLLLQNHAGQQYLIDGGGLYSQRFDVGSRLLAPAFGVLGVRRLDKVFLTHNHADHWKGLVYLLKHYPVGEFVVGEPLETYHPDLVRVVLERNIPVRVPDQGWTPLPEWETGRLSVFNGSAGAANPNDASVVLYLQSDDRHGMLLTGDLEAAGIDALLNAGLPGPVTLLKIPHHGSTKSRTAELAQLLRPQVGLISVGYQNSYRLPAKDVMMDLEQQGVAVWRSDLDGTVRVESGPAGWQVRGWHGGIFR